MPVSILTVTSKHRDDVLGKEGMGNSTAGQTFGAGSGLQGPTFGKGGRLKLQLRTTQSSTSLPRCPW